MKYYIFRRLALMAVVLLIVITITFLLTTIAPSDPAAQWAGTRPTPEQLEETLQDIIASPKTLTADAVIKAVARFYHVPEQEITGRKRNKDIVRPRQVAMYLARTETQASLPEIGDLLGGRDHTTVIYGVDKVEGQLDEDNTLRREVMAIKEELYHTNR